MWVGGGFVGVGSMLGLPSGVNNPEERNDELMDFSVFIVAMKIISPSKLCSALTAFGLVRFGRSQIMDRGLWWTSLWVCCFLDGYIRGRYMMVCSCWRAYDDTKHIPLF